MASTILLSDNGATSGISGYQLTGGTDGTLTIQTTTSGGAPTTALAINNSQNVGIGTSSPSARLHVTSSASGSYGAVIYNTSATGQGLTVRGGSTSSQDAFNVQTYDGGTSLFAVQGGGNVGIGTSSPTAKLQVDTGRVYIEGNNEQYCLRLAYNNATSGVYLGSPSANTFAVTDNGGTERLRIDSSGRVTMPYQPAFSAYLPSGYSPAVNSVITMSGVRTNIGGAYNASTYRFTAPVAGLYEFASCIGFQTAVSYGTVYGLHKNGSRLHDVEVNSGSGWQTGTIVCFVELAVGDYVDLRALVGGVPADSGNWSYWGGRLVQ